MAALEKLSIDTPEQIALEFNLATVGSRFLALAIDTLIQLGGALGLFGVMALVRLLTGPLGQQNAPWIMAIVVLGWFVIYYGYYAIFEAMWNGQTPGKRVVGLRVIHTSGRPISAYEAVLRNVVRLVDQFPGIYAIGIVAVFLTGRSQRLGDLAASTVVVHERLAEATPVVDIQRSSATAVPLGGGRLTPEEAAVIEMFLRRRDELDGGARVHTAARVAERMRARLGITTRIDNERLLEDLLAEHRSKRHYG